MTSENIVKLNVGGTVFQTSRTTLSKFDSMLKAMMETGVPLTRDESNCIFIDRDPTHFRYILNFMRDAKINLPNALEDVKDIQVEAQYYLLTDLVEYCNVELQKRMKALEPPILNEMGQPLQSLLEPSNPIVTIFYVLDDNGKAVCPEGFDIRDFVNRHRDKVEFKFISSGSPRPGPLSANPTEWYWTITWKKKIFRGSASLVGMISNGKAVKKNVVLFDSELENFIENFFGSAYYS